MYMKFSYLADHPELVPLLASWFYEEWGRRNPANSIDRVEESLRGKMNRNKPPLALAAFLGRKVVGSASLKIREMDTHPHLMHWLGSLYVREKYRNQGIGSRIVEFSEEEARRLGIGELYPYTHGHEGFYSRLGWIPVERTHYHGRKVVIMKRVLAI